MKEIFEIIDFESNKHISNVDVILNDGETIKIINNNNLEIDTTIKYLPKSNIIYKIHHGRNFRGAVYLIYGFDYTNIMYKHNSFYFYKTTSNLLNSNDITELKQDIKQYYNLYIMDENFKLLYYTKYKINGIENTLDFDTNYVLYDSNDRYCEKYKDVDELINNL